MRVRSAVPAAAIVLLAVACASGRVDPLSRSSLPQTVPPVAPSAVLEALPEPADFGPGWRFDTDELGSDDYFVEYSRGRVARECPGADPVAAGVPVESPEAISGVLRLDGQDGSVSVRVGVDSPARAADRLALVRASFSGCDRLEYESEGRTATEDREPLDRPEAGGDESVAVRVRIVGQNEPGEEFVATFAYARAGGLVVGPGSAGRSTALIKAQTSLVDLHERHQCLDQRRNRGSPLLCQRHRSLPTSAAP